MKDDINTLAQLLQSELSVAASNEEVIDENALMTGIRTRVLVSA